MCSWDHLTKYNFKHVCRQAWSRISTSEDHDFSAPSLVTVVIRSGNAHNSDAKELRNMKHNDCVFLIPNGLSAEWQAWRKQFWAILVTEEIKIIGFHFFAWIEQQKKAENKVHFHKNWYFIYFGEAMYLCRPQSWRQKSMFGNYDTAVWGVIFLAPSQTF